MLFKSPYTFLLMHLSITKPLKSTCLLLQILFICLSLYGHLVASSSAAPVAPAETVRPALPAGKVDDAMLASAEHMSEDELRELMGLYVKKKDRLMAIKIAHLLLQKDGDDEAARALLKGAGVPAVEEDAAADAPESPVIAQARQLAAAGQAKAAAALYEQARTAQDPKVPFPFAMELASAYVDAGLPVQAQAAYALVADDATAPAADRAEATQRLTELRRDAQLTAADLSLDEGKIDEARRLLAELPAADQQSPEARLLEGKIKLLGGDAAAGEAQLMQMSLDQTLAPELREEAKATLAEVKINHLIKAGEGAFAKGNHQLAMSLSEELYGLAPQRTDVVQFRARTLLQNKQPDLALQVLEQSPAIKGSESETDHSRLLGTALENTSSYQRALEVYRELATHRKLSLLDQGDLFDDADTLAAIASPRFSSDWRFMDAEEGRWNAVRVNLQSGILAHGLQFIGEGFWDAVAPSDGARFSGKTEADLTEVAGSMRAYFSGQRYLQGGLIGHRDGVGFGVSAGKLPLDGLGYQLRYDHQQRAGYSQALRSLNGRQNKVAGSLQTTFSSGLSLDTTFGWRDITVDGVSLGNGLMFELALMKTVLQEKASRPGISIAYMGELSRTSQNNTVEVRRAIGLDPLNPTNRLADLMDPRVNRHEIQINVTRHWTEHFQTNFTGALGYEFEDQQSVFLLGFQLVYRLRPNLKLTLQGDYDSSGQGVNAFNAMKSLWFGVSMDY